MVPNMFQRVLTNNRGQSAVEFMLVLPFFLLVVLSFLVFVMVVFSGQMTTYATFWGARAAVVHGEHEKASQAVLPRIDLSISGGPNIKVTGSYTMTPLLGNAPGSVLDSPMAGAFDLKTTVKMHQFEAKAAGACSDLLYDDNPIGVDCFK